MEFNIEIDHEVRDDCAVRYRSLDSQNTSIIYISGFFCIFCSADQTNVFLPHMLEHEIVEILSNNIRYEDGERNMDVKGFDRLSLKWHYKTENHICGEGIKDMWSA